MKKLILIAFLLSACTTERKQTKSPDKRTNWTEDDDQECQILITHDTIPDWYATIPNRHNF